MKSDLSVHSDRYSLSTNQVSNPTWAPGTKTSKANSSWASARKQGRGRRGAGLPKVPRIPLDLSFSSLYLYLFKKDKVHIKQEFHMNNRLGSLKLDSWLAWWVSLSAWVGSLSLRNTAKDSNLGACTPHTEAISTRCFQSVSAPRSFKFLPADLLRKKRTPWYHKGELSQTLNHDLLNHPNLSLINSHHFRQTSYRYKKRSYLQTVQSCTLPGWTPAPLLTSHLTLNVLCHLSAAQTLHLIAGMTRTGTSRLARRI